MPETNGFPVPLIATSDFAKRGIFVNDLLGPPKTRNYRPSIAIGLPSWAGPTGWGYFSLSIIDEMLRDWQVSQAFAFKKAPLMTAEFEIEASAPEVQTFVEEMYDRYWKKSLRVSARSMPYGFVPAEPLYKEEDGVVKFDALKPIHPRDAKPFTDNGTLAYVKVTHMNHMPHMDEEKDFPDERGGLKLLGPDKRRPTKGFWQTYDSDFNVWWGRPASMPSWWPWRLKTMPDGAMEIAFKAFYKHGFSGCVARHPNEHYVDPTTNQPMAAQDFIRQIMEQMKAGADIALSSEKDEAGEFKWIIEKYGGEAKGDFSQLIEYPDWLDRLIVRGWGIPDELLTHEGSTGGYSRSNIAFLAFLIMLEEVLNHLVETFNDQIGDPLVRLNFGPDAWYKVKPKPLIPDVGAMPQLGKKPNEGQQKPGEKPVKVGEPPEFGQDANEKEPQRLASQELNFAHAPAGYTVARPLVIGGKKFIGGEFIPGEVLARATPEEKAKLQGQPSSPAGAKSPEVVRGRPSASKGPRVPMAKPNAKAIRALRSHKPSTREKQRFAEALETEVARALGGSQADDNRPFDVIVPHAKGEHGVEIKTMLDNGNDKITMHPDARRRKESWGRKRGKIIHTIVLDMRHKFQGGVNKHQHSGHVIHYKRGVGAFRLGNLHKAKDFKEVASLLNHPQEELPEAAR